MNREALKNPYEYRREGTAWGDGVEGGWKKERPDLTYEDYWIYVCLVGHREYQSYLTAHINDDIMMETLTWL